MQFTKLKLSGFKSFVEHTELPIEIGLTGVVGPNGCGKSNLLEALRWVMGETSAKQMRGGGMEDVIFNGTSSRPPRNVAEVNVALDNRDRTAPVLFNDFEDLDVSRRIERSAGSQYRVNGKDVRARDVQLLFADAATGARSTALVSQGRIGAIIAAKPTQRRALLEEAAGITGLHSRRHEAELRLRAAETNLERLDDVMVTMESQLANLRKQARQASRYRNLSDRIRTAEGGLFAVRWEQAIDKLDRARTVFEDAEARVADLTGKAVQAVSLQADAAAVLPQRRHDEAAAAAALQRLVVAREGLEAEERRIAAAQEECAQRIVQIEGDAVREQRQDREADTLIARLEEERDGLRLAAEGEDDARVAAQAEVDVASREVDTLDGALAVLTDELAAAEARRNHLRRRIDEITQRQARFQQRAGELTAQRRSLEADAIGDEIVRAGEANVTAGEKAAEQARQALDAAEAERLAARAAVEDAVRVVRGAESELTRIEAEQKALEELLRVDGADAWPPVIDDLTVEPGYETALGVSLGEDLSAPADQQAPVHWTDLGPLDAAAALPRGATPLSGFVRGAAVLDRRLAQIGVVADAASGRNLAAALKPGQRLVSREGALWRWDGLTVAAGAPTAAATRLKQRNRLADLKEAQGTAARAQARAEADLTDRRTRQDAADGAETAARAALRGIETQLNQAREDLARLRHRAAAQVSQLSTLVANLEQIEADLSEGAAALQEATQERQGLEDTATGRERVAEMRAALAERRAILAAAQQALNNIVRDAETRRHRLAGIESERLTWVRRKETVDSHLGALRDRLDLARRDQAALHSKPAEIAVQRDALLDKIQNAEAARRAAADALADAEQVQMESNRLAREAEARLAAAREERVRAEANVDQGKENCRAIAERIAERLDCAPEATRGIAGLKDDDPLPELAIQEKRVERLLRERDNMGPVNLRAEQEAQELGEQIDGLNTERDDLLKAIDRLRRAINELNREGRERLLTSFKEVDKHFQELFARLYGGGHAHLQLIESDDPLEAGLEIMASPPGKRPQTLSLLSGGEQALTALALLFAVFLTNPAPICVLDEVDAPLDDANVDRFCSLLDEMAHSGRTRFLVITHHRMTMARMDRLFGVTMSERGVSQLVSVDLQAAEEMTTS